MTSRCHPCSSKELGSKTKPQEKCVTNREDYCDYINYQFHSRHGGKLEARSGDFHPSVPETVVSDGCSHQNNTIGIATHEAHPVVAQEQVFSPLMKSYAYNKGYAQRALCPFYLE